MQRQVLTWSLTGISAVLGFMLTVQLTSSHAQNTTTDMSSYLDLRTQMTEQLTEHKVLMSDIAKESAQLAQYRAAQGSEGALQRALEADERAQAVAAGMTEVRGPGITILIRSDPKLPFVQEYASQFANESDVVISQIVNDLFANGAYAISINGQRLVTTSSIRLVAGLSGIGRLEVNTYPVAPPYVISAIGDIDHMQAALTVDNVKLALNLMQEDCIIQVHRGKDGVEVPPYNGPLPGEWAKEVSNP